MNWIAPITVVVLALWIGANYWYHRIKIRETTWKFIHQVGGERERDTWIKKNLPNDK